MAVLGSLRASSCVLPKAEQPSEQGYVAKGATAGFTSILKGITAGTPTLI